MSRSSFSEPRRETRKSLLGLSTLLSRPSFFRIYSSLLPAHLPARRVRRPPASWLPCDKQTCNFHTLIFAPKRNLTWCSAPGRRRGWPQPGGRGWSPSAPWTTWKRGGECRLNKPFSSWTIKITASRNVRSPESPSQF